jgi:hypothetical protein
MPLPWLLLLPCPAWLLPSCLLQVVFLPCRWRHQTEASWPCEAAGQQVRATLPSLLLHPLSSAA